MTRAFSLAAELTAAPVVVADGSVLIALTTLI